MGGGLTAVDIVGSGGTILSVFAAGIMSLVMLTNSAARKQVRPRLLMALALTDFMYSLLNILMDVGIIITGVTLNNIAQWPDYLHLLFVLQQLFGSASWLWTALIAEHCAFVAETHPEPNGPDERKRERLIYALWAVVAVLVVTPLQIYTNYAPLKYSVPSAKIFSLLFPLLLIIWVVVSAIRVIYSRIRTSKAEVGYARQISCFVAVFIVCLVPQVCFNATLLRDREPPPSEELALALQEFLPFCNAVIWGLSRSCAVRCLGLCCYGSADAMLNDNHGTHIVFHVYPV